MTEQELRAYIEAIRPADETAMDAARRRQAQLAKPPGSLGQLEELSIRLAGVTGQVCPAMDKCRVAVFAADNGVVAEGVSCTPPSVTLQQAVNMTFRKTGMSAMAAAFGDDVAVVDVGIDGDVPPVGILDRKVRRGTGNIVREDAMTRRQVLEAMAAGMEQAALAKADGVTALGIGEMGIGNTTTSAAVLAALTGADVEAVTGRGGGLTDEGFLRKKEVLRQSLALHRPDKSDVIGVLAGVGGLDLAAMTGAFLGCAHERVPAAVDGFISIAAALCAVRLCPAVRDYLFLSHDSYEVGYRIAAEELGLRGIIAQKIYDPDLQNLHNNDYSSVPGQAAQKLQAKPLSLWRSRCSPSSWSISAASNPLPGPTFCRAFSWSSSSRRSRPSAGVLPM